MIKIHLFTRKWSDLYFAEREKGLKNSRIISLLVFLFLVILFALQIFNFRQDWMEFETYYVQNSSELEQIHANQLRAIIYQSVIVIGSFIQCISLLFNGRYALRFAEFAGLLAFFAWLGHFVWTKAVLTELTKSFDICFSSTLLYTPHLIAWLISIGFIFFIGYKILFGIVITWKTIRK